MTAERAERAARILLVDDDRDLVEILKIALEAHGYTILCAHTPEDGIRRTDEERPDLIVLDVMIPDATEGFHVVWKLRRRAEAYFHQVPIIMLTAVHQRTPLRFYPDARDGTYSAGEYLDVQEFIDKPVEPKVLAATIERVLRAAHSAAAPA